MKKNLESKHIPAESAHAEISDEAVVLPEWLLDATIDVEETIKEIKENRGE